MRTNPAGRLIQCHSCRKWGAPFWRVHPDGRREMIAPCCELSGGAATPDVACWLRGRAVRVARLINARRHVPSLTP